MRCPFSVELHWRPEWVIGVMPPRSGILTSEAPSIDLVSQLLFLVYN